MATLEEHELPSACWYYTPSEGIIQLAHFQMQHFWMLLSCTGLQNVPLSQHRALSSASPTVALAPLLRACPPVAVPFLPPSLARLSLHARLRSDSVTSLQPTVVSSLQGPAALLGNPIQLMPTCSLSISLELISLISKDCSLRDRRILAFRFFLIPS